MAPSSRSRTAVIVYTEAHRVQGLHRETLDWGEDCKLLFGDRIGLVNCVFLIPGFGSTNRVVGLAHIPIQLQQRVRI